MNAADHGLVQCEVCGTLSQVPPKAPEHLQWRCPACRARLSVPDAQSGKRTVAFLVAAGVLYIPANVLPIMQTQSLRGAQDDTILSGVLYLWWVGSWPLAVLVFVASILIPMLKLMTLAYLVWSVRKNAPAGREKARYQLYRLVELIGPWSMLDVYVVALLVALVHFGGMASIHPGPAAMAFGAVVVLTMLAAHAFDPRLLWQKHT